MLENWTKIQSYYNTIRRFVVLKNLTEYFKFDINIKRVERID